MKAWVKFALLGGMLGGIWGISGCAIATLLFGVLTNSVPISTQIMHHLMCLPVDIALKLGFHFYALFIGAPLIGFIIGATTGALISLLIQHLKNNKI